MPDSVTLDITEARKRISQLEDLLKESPVVYVTRHDRRAFAVVNPEYLDVVRDTLEILSDPEALQALNDSLADVAAGRVVDHDDLKRELGL